MRSIRRPVTLLAGVTAAVLATAPAQATTFRFAPAADTYASAAGPGRDHGLRPYMKVDASPRRRAYLRFRVHGLNGPVAQATLVLYALSDAGPAGVTARRVRRPAWRETALSYATAPALGASVSRAGGFAARARVKLDVTPLVAGSGVVDVGLSTRSTRALRFATRESARPPKLVVQTPTRPPAAPGWVNVVDDRFDAGGVPAHWKLYDGPYGSDPHNCATPSHVSVSGGAMHMLMRHETSGRCGSTWYTAGMQIARGYGSVDQRVTVRWRIVPNGVSSHRIIPMRFPDTGSWPAAGEEDYCEGGALTGCSTFLHYGPRSPGAQVFGDHAFSPGLLNWHVMRFQRLHHVITAWIDDMVSPAWTYVGDATTLPDTVKRVVLQQECHSGGCPAATTGSEDVQIDWITIDDPAPAA